MKNELTKKELDMIKNAKPNMKPNAFLSHAEKEKDKKNTNTEIKKTKQNDYRKDV